MIISFGFPQGYYSTIPPPRQGQFSVSYPPAPALAEAVGFWYNYRDALPCPIWQQRGGGTMEVLTNFLVSVVAGVLCYYICKWLDRR